MQDQGVREPCPRVTRHERHQVALDLHRVLLGRQPEQGREPLDVGVDHDTFVLSEPGAEHHIRGFATDAREPHQLVHRVGHLAAVALDQRLGHPDDRLGLVPEESGAVDLLLENLRVGAGVVPRGTILREQGGGDDVDPCIGRLGGENRGDEQLECAGVVQRAGRVGIGLLEARDDLADPRPPLGLAFAARASSRWGFRFGGHQPAVTRACLSMRVRST